MKFVLVNARTPCPQSFCAGCCEPIGEGYLRGFVSRTGHKPCGSTLCVE